MSKDFMMDISLFAMKQIVLVLLFLTLPSTFSAQNTHRDKWLTYYERSGCTKTPRYDETIAYCQQLESASPWIRYMSFGTSPQGRDLPLVILSRDRAFSPVKAAASGKAIVLIQSGIHAGEIDGKDASLMLMRDIAITKKYAGLLDSATLLFIPIFNVDGHERFGPYNRINQNGPEETGWRVNAQNLNLNRDYMKADTPEMRALLSLFTAWLPDLYVDIHVTDGMDFQYDVTYAVETGPNIEPFVGAWVKEHLLPQLLPRVEAAGHKIFEYVSPREEDTLTKGFEFGATGPRLSNGYAAVQNRPGLLIETHALKPYRTRVEAAYEVVKATLEAVCLSLSGLRSAVRQADAATTYKGSYYSEGKGLPLTFGVGRDSVMRTFLGYASRTERSEISGGQRRIYTGEPVAIKAPLFNTSVVRDSVTIPLAYLVPQEWSFIPDIMRLHGVSMERLTRADTLEVESYRFHDVKFSAVPYEGRHRVHFVAEKIVGRRAYPRGTVVIRTNQRAAKVAMHLLEPRSPDSFVAWGFFSAIFEQKEGAEAYVMEEIGRTMLAEDLRLRNEFEQKVKTDTSFANDPGARLDWLYRHSPWNDPRQNVYPVGRLITDASLETEPLR
jgi:murein tripeptide amidase MpaA